MGSADHVLSGILRLFSNKIIEIAYQGVLMREVDSTGLAAYSKTLKRSTGLSNLLRELSASDEHWKNSVAARSEEIVRALFQGMLGREPESESLPGYAATLNQTHDLKPLLAEISNSDEHWGKSLAARADEVVEAVFCGLLERVPNTEAHQSYAEQLARSKDLSGILAAVAQSQEHWEKLLSQRSHELIAASFQGLLERAPDAEALQTYSEQLAQSKDLSGILAAVSQSQEHWDKLLGQRSKELIVASFQGLLKRAPDAEALQSYSQQLVQTKDLSEILTAVARSQEHWELLISQRSEELVNASFLGLLERVPDAEALRSYTSQLAETKDIRGLLAALTRSQEYWTTVLGQRSEEIAEAVLRGLGYAEPEDDTPSRYADSLRNHRSLSELITEISKSEGYLNFQFRLQAPKLIEGIYQGLLNRSADEKGLLAYVQKISKASDIGLVITQICQSGEYIAKVQGDERKGMKTVSKRALTIDHIEKIYQRYQHRSATNDELATHLSQEDSVGRVLSYLLPRSKKNRPPRVLLFGAFGNGNIGDAYQAMAVRSHLKKSWGLNDDAIFACSLLSNTAYPFPKENKLPSSSIFDYELVNSFDCLIVGGGGLLAHPHEPLFDAAWTQRIDVPIVLLSIGASTSNVHAHSQLLENALLVSGRDSESLDALKLLRADALLIPDPILSVEEIQSLTELDELPSSAPGDIDVLWILKYPSNDFDINILRWIARYISDDVSRKHVIVAIEPRIDIALGEYFPNESISYFYDLAGLHKNIEKSRFVFSMRYHGAIFSIMASKPVFGFSQKKIKALFDEAGLYGGYLESVRDLEKVLSSLDAIMPRSNKNLSSCQKRFSDAFMLVGADFTSLYDEEATDKCH